jgi:uncharacterized membrane protein
VYLAFSTFVMPGLRKLPPAHAISAMNSINKAAPSNPLLTLVLFGTGIVCVRTWRWTSRALPGCPRTTS